MIALGLIVAGVVFSVVAAMMYVILKATKDDKNRWHL